MKRITRRTAIGTALAGLTASSLAPSKDAKMNKPAWDSVVIGAGVFGAWTAYLLRQSGRSVVLFDAYGPGNSRASSGGESRIIRMGYGAAEIYTRWSIRAPTA